MTIIPSSQTFDQSTLCKLLEHDPIVQRYRDFFAFFDWSVLPDPLIDPARPGKRPHPETAYIKTLLIKVVEGYGSCTKVRQYLLEHPLLVLELGFRPLLNASLPYGFDVGKTVPTARWLRHKQASLSQALLQALLAATVQALCQTIPGLGETVAFDVTHIYAWVKENNLRVYVKDRYKKEVQPRGDRDCRLGVKKGSNQQKAEDKHTSPPAPLQGQHQAPATATKDRTPKPGKRAKPHSKKAEGTQEGKECLWGYGSGVASATVAGYGDVVRASVDATL